jgi:hypothetical protein
MAVGWLFCLAHPHKQLKNPPPQPSVIILNHFPYFGVRGIFVFGKDPDALPAALQKVYELVGA